ncbi:MAG: putative bifunctional diguanylate cyclase/phosphodiesterase, partial [Xanthobacteraceae bacterium]
HVPAIVMVKDVTTLRYVLVNKRAEEFISRPASEVIGKTPHEIFEPQFADKIVATDRETLTGMANNFTGPPLHDTGHAQQVISTKKAIIAGPDGNPQYLVSIVEDITERAHASERVAYMSRYDTLTGLGNRLLFVERVTELLLETPPRHFNVLMLDLDHFKDVNESLGHPVGDAMLMAIAARLKGLVGAEDFIARLSGDEFAVLQIAADDNGDAAINLANRLLETLNEPVEFEGNQVAIGASIGIATAPEHGENADELMKCAELALNRAKTKGRNQYQVFAPTMEKEASVRRTLELELRRALANQEFVLRYQPVVNALNQEIVGVEALVRWNSPVKGLVPPDRFIPLAEETGLIVPIGEWVMRRACLDAAEWPGDIKVAVNLSAIQFSKGDIVGLVSEALEESGLAPERLELEITETVLLHKNEDNISLLHALKNLGVAIVLDDFGTGYSSLSYLKMFPFDKIKIDRSFINELSTRTDCAAIVCAVTGLGRSLNIATTAEGVETQEQFTLLRAVGCTQIQGYLFGRPMPAAELQLKAAEHGTPHRAPRLVKAPLAAPAPYPDATDLPRQIA